MRTSLVPCEPFASDRQLRPLFGDPRLRPWRNHLQSAPDPITRAEMFIGLLQGRHSATGENALAHLLRAPAERHPGDAVESDLATLADAVQARAETAHPPLTRTLAPVNCA
ncbi:MAG: hypothetical protein R3248_07495 [Candidatus Promineifilaceae bacterium]|nr:hypothetical protein [Candidatus Promineifilaceae bacterium]